MIKKINVYTAGTWDLFHYGHLNILKCSKALGDNLIVGVSTSELVKRYKQDTPIISYADRVSILKACKYVDKVVKQTELISIDHLKLYKIDVITIGSDWENKYLEGIEWAKKNGIRVVYIPYTAGVSTTWIKEKIINKANIIKKCLKSRRLV